MQRFYLMVLLVSLNLEHKFHTVPKHKKTRTKHQKQSKTSFFYVGYAFLLLKCQQETAGQAQDGEKPAKTSISF